MNEAMLMLMTQVDDVPGELLGDFIKQCETVGARNIQIVPAITKKNRPSYLVYVDIPESLEDDVAILFGGELGTWGYRILHAEHKHFDIQRSTLVLKVAALDDEYEFELRAKTISKAQQFTRVKAEYEDLSHICTVFREKGLKIPLSVLKAEVEGQILKNGHQAVINVSF